MKILSRLKKVSIIVLTLFILVLSQSYTAFAQENYVFLGGNVLGFTINTEGATVVGITDVITDGGLISPCEKAGIMVGDIVLNMNGTDVNSSSDVSNVLKNYKNGEIVTKISRNGKIILVDLIPVKDLNGEFKLGIFIRDDLSGLGTVTYYNKDGSFASLGHPVSDQKGGLYKVVSGNAYNSSIIGVNKAKKGKAGELRGVIINDNPIGSIKCNTKVGLFGKIYNFNEKKHEKICYSTAKQGKAQIYSTVDGAKPKLYDIDIIKTDFSNKANKNLVIKISDSKLLEYTGGILQGMSGSPIIQDGKLVGAVTHVFINDSSRGYGISIMNMINQN